MTTTPDNLGGISSAAPYEKPSTRAEGSTVGACGNVLPLYGSTASISCHLAAGHAGMHSDGVTQWTVGPPDLRDEQLKQAMAENARLRVDKSAANFEAARREAELRAKLEVVEKQRDEAQAERREAQQRLSALASEASAVADELALGGKRPPLAKRLRAAVEQASPGYCDGCGGPCRDESAPETAPESPLPAQPAPVVAEPTKFKFGPRNLNLDPDNSSQPELPAEPTERKFIVTREECEATISGVCPGCGGKVTALETVDNANQPTHWSGCEHCSVYTEGCPAEIHRLARTLVEEGTLVPYPRDRNDPTWLESNTRQAAHILRRIDRLRSGPAEPTPDSQEGAEGGKVRTQVRLLHDRLQDAERAIGEATKALGLLSWHAPSVEVERLTAERDTAVKARDSLLNAADFETGTEIDFAAGAIRSMLDSSRLLRTQIRPQLARAEADAQEHARHRAAAEQRVRELEQQRDEVAKIADEWHDMAQGLTDASELGMVYRGGAAALRIALSQPAANTTQSPGGCDEQA